MLLKRWTVPGKEAARSEEPLAARQLCPQRYTKDKSLCICYPEDSFIYFPLNLENRSLFFSYLYQTSGSRDNVNLPVPHRKASAQKEFHLSAKDRDNRAVLLCTRLHSFWRAAASIQTPWTTSSLLQEVWPASTFADIIPMYSGAPSRVHTSALRESASSPHLLGTAQHRAANSSCWLHEGQRISQLISCTSEDNQWRQACNSHLRPMYMRFTPGTDMERGRGALDTGIHLLTVPRWTSCRLRYINNVYFVRLLTQVLLPFIHF